LQDNVEKYGTVRQTTDDNMIRRIFLECRVTEVTDTHSEYVILISFPLQQLFCESSWRSTWLNLCVFLG